MIIQFNLLPDVKIEYIKSQRTKRVVMFIAGIVTAASLFILILLLFFVTVVQGRHLSNLTTDIETDSAKLKEIEDLDKVLTIQNQLHSLPELHDSKPLASKLFSYLEKLTPQTASISRVDLNFDTVALSITGDADALSTVNSFVDTIKFATYTTADITEQTPAFSNVVLTSFSRSDTTEVHPVSYQIDFMFDPVMFDNSQTVTLTVPSIVTTRSSLEKPDALFQVQPSTGEEE